MAATAGVGAAAVAARSGVDAATGAAEAPAGGDGPARGHPTGTGGSIRAARSRAGQCREAGRIRRGAQRQPSRPRPTSIARKPASSPAVPVASAAPGRSEERQSGDGRAVDPEGVRRTVAEHGTLYNFGVLTKRYELVSRTAGQLAPGVAGRRMRILDDPGAVPRCRLPFAPCWSASGSPSGRCPSAATGAPRCAPWSVPFARYGLLRLAGKASWEMPDLAGRRRSTRPPPTRSTRSIWTSSALVDAAPSSTSQRDRDPETPSRPNSGSRPRTSTKGGGRTAATRTGPAALEAVHLDGSEAGLVIERAGRRRLLTAVISVSGGDRFVFSGPDEQAAQIIQWGEV